MNDSSVCACHYWKYILLCTIRETLTGNYSVRTFHTFPTAICSVRSVFTCSLVLCPSRSTAERTCLKVSLSNPAIIDSHIHSVYSGTRIIILLYFINYTIQHFAKLILVSVNLLYVLDFILHCAVDPGYFEGVKKVLNFGTVQKELVDPYCIVSFAGKKGKTPVIWNEQDPEWNHQLNLGIRV